MKRVILALLAFCLAFAMVGCRSKDEDRLTIALQYGLAYAPLIVARDTGMLEEAMPDKQIEWVQLANSTAIREAMTAGELDVGFMGIPPFLIAFDKGVRWHIFCGLCQSPVALMANDDGLDKLADFTDDMRIATPQPGSIQHILLMMAAERELGDVSRFDRQLVSLKHPDAMAMLLSSDEVTAHFASPPYVFMERDAGMKRVVDGRTAFGGDYSFIVGVAYENNHLSDRDLAALRAVIAKANSYIAENRSDTIKIMSNYFDLSDEVIESYLYDDELIYTTEVKGVKQFVDFMHKVDYLSKPYQLNEVIRE